jgi:hypothetical protein
VIECVIECVIKCLIKRLIKRLIYASVNRRIDYGATLAEIRPVIRG